MYFEGLCSHIEHKYDYSGYDVMFVPLDDTDLLLTQEFCVWLESFIDIRKGVWRSGDINGRNLYFLNFHEFLNLYEIDK